MIPALAALAEIAVISISGPLKRRRIERVTASEASKPAACR
jgi:hypothetical protein